MRTCVIVSTIAHFVASARIADDFCFSWSHTHCLRLVQSFRYKMACNVCNVVISLFDDAHRIAVSGDICGCGSGTLDVVFNKNKTPLPDGGTELSGCPFCHELLSTLIEVKKGASRHPMHRRGRGGRGRGRGRGRGGRGGKGKMAQLDNYFL